LIAVSSAHRHRKDRKARAEKSAAGLFVWNSRIGRRPPIDAATPNALPGVASAPSSEPSHHWSPCANMTDRGANVTRRTRPHDGIRFAPQMIRAHTAIMPHISIRRRDIDDRLSDLACACRSPRHCSIGGILVSIDIIQFILRPKRDDLQTDFPTIVFRLRGIRSGLLRPPPHLRPQGWRGH
jgi:hypothetical protein